MTSDTFELGRPEARVRLASITLKIKIAKRTVHACNDKVVSSWQPKKTRPLSEQPSEEKEHRIRPENECEDCLAVQRASAWLLGTES